MRVISKFRDYYDGVRSIDRDDDPLYVRETREYVLGEMSGRDTRALLAQVVPLWTDFNVPPAARDLRIERAVIGFCGRAYGLYRIAGRVADIDEVLALEASTSWYSLSTHTWNRYLAVHREDVGDAPFVAMRAPIVVVTDRSVIVNPMLKPWGFAARFDPYSAWQELSLYIGNNLANALAREPRPISDELKAHAHGFDKQSFRNTRNRAKSHRGDW